MSDKEEDINIEEYENVTINPDKSVTLTLETPISWGSDTNITALHFRRGKAADLQKAKAKDKVEESIAIISRLTGQTPAAIAELDLADFMTANEIIKFFTARSRKTGNSGSGS